MSPVLYLIVPCYNEEAVLPVTAPVFLEKLMGMIQREKIAPESRILFVDDGSRDETWSIISALARQDAHVLGISQSRNRGHQNALVAGLMEARERCDITITMDCDGQDDPEVMEAMVEKYLAGNDVVYGVRSDRDTDTAFKRSTARWYYRLLRWLGAEVVYDHADYRLLSRPVLDALADYHEVNLFLRGLIPLVGFRSDAVPYSRKARAAGETHYPLGKMVALALDGVTSLSVKPLRLIMGFGAVVALVSFIGVIWALIRAFSGHTVAGWASTTCIVCFVSGVQLISLGILGEYIGKIYLETKGRPRYIISRRTWEE